MKSEFVGSLWLLSDVHLMAVLLKDEWMNTGSVILQLSWIFLLSQFKCHFQLMAYRYTLKVDSIYSFNFDVIYSETLVLFSCLGPKIYIWFCLGLLHFLGFCSSFSRVFKRCFRSEPTAEQVYGP